MDLRSLAAKKQVEQATRQRKVKEIAAKKALRGGKKAMEQKTKETERTFRLNNNNDIRTVAIALMMDVERIYKCKAGLNIPAVDKELKGRYDFFKKNYFGIRP